MLQQYLKTKTKKNSIWKNRANHIEFHEKFQKNLLKFLQKKKNDFHRFPRRFSTCGVESRNNRLQGEGRMKRKQNQTIRENPCSRITVWKGARDSRISNAGREIYPRGAIDEQTTEPNHIEFIETFQKIRLKFLQKKRLRRLETIFNLRSGAETIFCKEKEGGEVEKAKPNDPWKSLFSHYCFEGARDSRISNAGREIYPRGAIDEQTTAQGAFLVVAVNFAIFNSLIAVCRALCTAESGALYFLPSPQG
ncbi:hypothetical protein CDAR_499271 [Caerostris darwini]|uniref:Uncharacterized protein n=1 Tax=Caerostris darwini TaxID=1538125 RepID=A0AAV4P1A9_9ARAC|nr:hypothetical protein CDAR_499271 [Caerostris darwini]